MNHRLFLLLFLPLMAACRPDTKRNYWTAYVQQAFDSIAVLSIHRHSCNLDSLEAEVLHTITDSITAGDILAEIERAIRAIDRHSYLLTREQYQKMAIGHPDIAQAPYPFQAKMLDGDYAFVALDGFLGVDSLSADQYTDSLQRVLVQLYDQRPKGWIIDLRNNTGGWVYPMLAGLGPILGGGEKAYEITANGDQEAYYYSRIDEETGERDRLLLSDSLWFFDRTLPVAVLIGGHTGSAGELLTLSFRGNPKTLLLGEPTYGVATGLRGFFMPDSTQICVTYSYMVDRYGRGDGGPVKPDVLETDPLRLFERAMRWIQEHQ